ncbi:MAG: 50S ribosomal protein L24 [Enterobacteriaceae bacterium PC38]|nr:MAG: 50S ribosomal protein L24 [Enterobacteriaceae bacterium PC38]
MINKIKKNDEVIVITGKNKGKIGKIYKIISKKKVFIKGLNLFKKHQKPIPSINQIGGIFKKENYIHISNIAIFNKHINKINKKGLTFKNKNIK